MYAIRSAEAEDVPALLAIDEHFDGHSHPEIVERALGEGRLVVAEGGGGIVGYVHWGYFWDSIPMCIMARVLAEHRRLGLGRRLYETVEEDLRRRGHAFWLSSTEETNDVSQRFHEELAHRRPGGAGAGCARGLLPEGFVVTCPLREAADPGGAGCVAATFRSPWSRWRPEGLRYIPYIPPGPEL